MKRTLTLLTGLTVLPLALAAQQNAVARLQQVLPASVADSVIAIVTNATNHGLPGQAIAERALETVAKTRNGQDAQAAAQALASDLQASHDALAGSGHQPSASEIEAGAQAMELGVSGSTISALAQSAPSGRSLAVPLAVLGALVNRGLPSDGALQAVSDRLTARASDTQLTQMPGQAGQMIAQGYRPADVGPALAAGRPGSVPANGGHPGAMPSHPGRPGH
ncbi:MAG TPA: hypothetical protein VJ992_12630 [Gemmatimonadales bacterium]|nr:hypothetical protein [Gemmatimonadales bacterium]